MAQQLPETATAAGAGRLAVRDLRKSYPTPAQPLEVLRGVSLDLSPGESLAVLGVSGSGKSTLLNIVGTLDRPTAGSVRVDGVDPFVLSATELAAYRSRRIGFVFQEHHLLPQCTALENVLLPKLALGRAGSADAQRAGELLGRVGLEGRATHLPGELSGGERQRVAIARSLINSPSLLLCDEPTGNLDAKNAAAVVDLLLELAAATRAMLITVTHSTTVAGRFGRRMRMEEGVLIDA